MVDIVALAEIALTAGSFGFVFGIGLKNFTKPRISAWIIGEIDNYVNGFMSNMANNPKFASEFVKPLISASFSELGIDKTSKGGDIKIGGLKLPRELVLGFAQKFLGDSTRKAAEEGTNMLLGGLNG